MLSLAFKSPHAVPVSFAKSQQPLRQAATRARQRRALRLPASAVLYRGSGELPGVLVLPGLGNSAEDYVGLAEALIDGGHCAVSIAHVARVDWMRNARGLMLPSYWRGTLTPNEVLEWYFKRVDAALKELRGLRMSIVGHSAGGWLARAYISDRMQRSHSAEAEPLPEFAALVTLGTPHLPPPKGTFDQTRGLLTYIARECKIDDIVKRAVCVAGRGIVGKKLGKGSLAENIAYYSYQALCGEGDVDGDGVIPLEAAFFGDAERIVVPQCRHSMVGGGQWYGSPESMGHWQKFLA